MLLKPDYMLDTGAMNARAQANMDNPFRNVTGTTHVPKDIDHTGPTFRKIIHDACSRFVAYFEKEGWQLDSKIRVLNPHEATDPDGKVIPDEIEYELHARFKKLGAPQLWRMEVPDQLVRREQDQEISLAAAAKAWGF